MSTPLSSRTVTLVDVPQRWMRQPADLVGAIVALLAIAGVVVLSAYARLTVLGVTNDVRAATSSLIEQLFFVPINVLEGVVSFFLPLALIVEMVFKRRWRTLVTAIVANLTAPFFGVVGPYCGRRIDLWGGVARHCLASDFYSPCSVFGGDCRVVDCCGVVPGFAFGAVGLDFNVTCGTVACAAG